MKNYLRRVRVCGLFEQEQDLVVDFEQAVNCIYGMNGTGKTVLINLIVNAFRVNRDELLASSFSSIVVLTAVDGKKQPEIFFTVNKNMNQLTYIFNGDYSFKSDGRASKVFNVKKGMEYTVGEAGWKHGFFEGLTEKFNFIPVEMLRNILAEHVSLTYVPLLRHAYISGATGFKQSNSLFQKESELYELYDPNSKVLADLQEEFSKRYASAQSVISRKLESLSSIILKKLFLESDVENGPLKESAYIDTLLRKGVIDDGVNVDDVISQVRDLNLDISNEMIREHYRQWNVIQTDLLGASRKFSKISDVDEDERKKIIDEYSKAYYKLLSSRKLYNKLESAIEEIKVVYLKKQFVLSSFNLFRSEINKFLCETKSFDFNDSGEFVFTNNGRPLHISKLSSGEKHLVAILGRVSFSPEGVSTFIADEPELSLHLEWQREILSSIRRLSPNTQIIVATHSPAIISKDSNLIDIEECYKNA